MVGPRVGSLLEKGVFWEVGWEEVRTLRTVISVVNKEKQNSENLFSSLFFKNSFIEI